MAHKAPGKHYRAGLTLIELTRMFPDDAAAERWFVKTRWPEGIHCPCCGSLNIQERETRKPQPYRCRDCRKDFSVKLGTLMEGSKLGFQTWAMAIYLMMTGIKGTSSMKLHRDLGITQKTAWHLAHRIRETWSDPESPFAGPVEVDETHIGGKEKNKHGRKKLRAGRGAVGKTTVVGAKDRATNTISAAVVEATDARTLQCFVASRAAEGAKVYTDQAAGYKGMPFDHEAVNHSISEYVRDQAHTNGIESFWAMLKRGYHGTYHHMSAKHLGRYVGEFSGRHNNRPADTIDQMQATTQGMVGKRLRLSGFGRMTANWQNRTLFHGDNLPFLRAMNSESIDLIATDPPFNKGRDFHATPDSLAAGARFQDRWSWERDVHEEWTDQITNDHPRLMEAIEGARYAHSDGMGAFICFMAVRLLAMRRVLKPTGSIYLHCDPTASHYLKAVMDAIFGWQNFRNEIVWQKIRSSKAQKAGFGPVHDILLFYRKSPQAKFENVYTPLAAERIARHYGKTEEGTGRRYGLDNFTQAGPGAPRRFGDRIIPPPPPPTGSTGYGIKRGLTGHGARGGLCSLRRV